MLIGEPKKVHTQLSTENLTYQKEMTIHSRSFWLDGKTNR